MISKLVSAASYLNVSPWICFFLIKEASVWDHVQVIGLDANVDAAIMIWNLNGEMSLPICDHRIIVNIIPCIFVTLISEIMCLLNILKTIQKIWHFHEE